MENVFLKTITDEATVAIEAKMTTPIVHPIGGRGMRYPPGESIYQQKHIQTTLPYQKQLLFPISFHHCGIHTNSTRAATVCYPTRSDLIHLIVRTTDIEYGFLVEAFVLTSTYFLLT